MLSMVREDKDDELISPLLVPKVRNLDLDKKKTEQINEMSLSSGSLSSEDSLSSNSAVSEVFQGNQGVPKAYNDKFDIK